MKQSVPCGHGSLRIDIPAGISLTELYDILELQNYDRNNVTYETTHSSVMIDSL
jgi:hypothetical protein